MKSVLIPVLAVFLGSGAWAQAAETPTESQPVEDAGLVIVPAEEADLDSYIWTARPVVVFANSPADPAFAQQMQLLKARPDELVERDVVVIVDTDPANPSKIRNTLRPRGFMLVLIGKDGRIELRKPSPWDVRELTRSIDKMPIRREEIRNPSGNP